MARPHRAYEGLAKAELQSQVDRLSSPTTKVAPIEHGDHVFTIPTWSTLLHLPLSAPNANQLSGEPGAMPKGDLPRGRRLKNGSERVAWHW